MADHASMTVHLPLGPGRLTASGVGLVALALGEEAGPGAGDSTPPVALETLQAAAEQLQAYFAGRLREFDLPLDLTGLTPFQRRVLEACAGLAYGATASYGELARRAGHPGAARAVGQVMAHNRLPLVVPCHRVVASGGGLGGYGLGLPLKQALLAFEQSGEEWPTGATNELNSPRG